MMFRELLSSRQIQAGLIFFVLVVGGSLLYSWHADHKMAAELGPIPQSVVSPPKNTETRTAAPVVSQNDGVTNTPDENTDTPMSDETEAETRDAPEFADIADAFLPEDFVSEAEEAPEADVPVSPFGFGPYPEIPEDYPSRPSWERAGYNTFSQDTQRELELLGRVLIKLWKQGRRGFRGGSTDNGKVYPHYKNTAYVRYRTNADGHRYIARYKGDPAIRISPEQLRSEELPSYIRVLDMDSEGIDPYTFLDLK